MSGGSYDYLYSKDKHEQVGLVVQNGKSLLAHLDQYVAVGVAYNEAYETDKKQHYERPITELERFACAATRERFQDFVKRATALVEEVEQFSGLLHSIEWTASCDTGPADVVDECVKYIQQKIGLNFAELMRKK